MIFVSPEYQLWCGYYPVSKSRKISSVFSLRGQVEVGVLLQPITIIFPVDNLHANRLIGFFEGGGKICSAIRIPFELIRENVAVYFLNIINFCLIFGSPEKSINLYETIKLSPLFYT
jgi:hypothetical protein